MASSAVNDRRTNDATVASSAIKVLIFTVLLQSSIVTEKQKIDDRNKEHYAKVLRGTRRYKYEMFLLRRASCRSLSLERSFKPTRNNLLSMLRSVIGLRHDSGGRVDETRVRLIEDRVEHGLQAASDADQLAGRTDVRPIGLAGMGPAGDGGAILKDILTDGISGAGLDFVPGYAERRGAQTRHPGTRVVEKIR